MSLKNRKIRQYDEDFKRQAVRLFHQTGKSFREIGDELGIPASSIAGWVYSKKYIDTQQNSDPETDALQKEVKTLRRDFAIIKEERDILKKALAIFSVEEPKR